MQKRSDCTNLDGLDHDPVLLGGGGDLHPAGSADARVRNVAVAADFVRSVDDDHPAADLVSQQPG